MTTNTTYAHDVAESFREGYLDASIFEIETLDSEDTENQNTIQVAEGDVIVRYYQDARNREGFTFFEIAPIALPAVDEDDAQGPFDDDRAYDLAKEDGTL